MIPNNDHLPFCCQDAVGNFSETSRLSVLHWTFPLDLCAFLANNFVRASEYAMLLSTITLKITNWDNYNLCFVFPFQNFPRSLKNFVTRNNVVVDQRSFDNRWTKKICFVVARTPGWFCVWLFNWTSLFFEDWSHILKGTMKIPSPEWSSKVLLLYRQILKRGKSLKYTDYDFFRRTIRREFEQQRDEVEIKVIKEQYEVLSHQFCNSSTVTLFWTLHHLFMFFLVNPHLIYGVHVHACHTLHPDC